VTRFPLAIRLLALGLAQLTALVLVAFMALRLEEHPLDMMRRLDAIEVAVHRAEQAHLALLPVLQAQERTSHLHLTVRDREGRVLASTVEPALELRRPPPREHHGPPPRDPHHGPFDFDPRIDEGPNPPIARLLESGSVLIARGDATSRLRVPLLIVFASLIVLGLGAWWMARSILRPLEQISSTARRLGEGDLKARVALSRNDELGAVANSLDEMAARIEGQVQRERELLANISHELRTPLARIHVAMDLAQEGHTAALEDVGDDLRELETLLDDVFLAFRFDARAGGEDANAHGGLPMRPFSPICVNALLRGCVKRFAAFRPGRVIEVQLDVPDEVDVLGDANVLRRAFDNLLSNADKYTPDATLPIALHASVQDGQVVVAVEDEGVGIVPEDRPLLFTPFFRADRSRERSTGGVGLGLALAKRILVAHRGGITVQHREKGTAFVVTLPIAK
jgi:signal transduction histidine kinase